MALVISKTISKNVPLIKCMRGPQIAALTKRCPPVAVNYAMKSTNCINRTKTTTSWSSNSNMVKQLPVFVVKKRGVSTLPRSVSCSTLTNRSTIRENYLQRSRSSVKLNEMTPAFISTAVNHGYSPAMNAFHSKNGLRGNSNRSGPVTQQKVSCSSGKKSDKDNMAAPGEIRAMGPCNCPWPGGCPPPGFCQQSSCPSCAIGPIGCCGPCPQCGPMPQCQQCQPCPQCPQCPMCGACNQCVAPCGPFVPCGACGACGPCPPPPCGGQMPAGGTYGTWGPCCAGGPAWGPQGVPCPFPCPCPCGPCEDPKKK